MASNTISIYDESFVCVTENGSIISNCFTEYVFLNRYVGCAHNTRTLTLLTSSNTLEIYGDAITVEKMDEVLSVTFWNNYFVIYYFDKSLIFIQTTYQSLPLTPIEDVVSYKVVNGCLHAKLKSEYLVYVPKAIGLVLISIIGLISKERSQVQKFVYIQTILNDKAENIVDVILHSDIIYTLDEQGDVCTSGKTIYKEIESFCTDTYYKTLFLFKSGITRIYNYGCRDLSTLSDSYTDLPTNIKKAYLFYRVLIYQDMLNDIYIQNIEGRFLMLNADILAVYKSNYLVYVVTCDMRMHVYCMQTKQFKPEHPLHSISVYSEQGTYI